jgi:hypothetical protein
VGRMGCRMGERALRNLYERGSYSNIMAAKVWAAYNKFHYLGVVIEFSGSWKILYPLATHFQTGYICLYSLFYQTLCTNEDRRRTRSPHSWRCAVNVFDSELMLDQPFDFLEIL